FVDVAAAHANALLRNDVELRELGLGIETQEAGRAVVDGVPDRAVGRMRHHGIWTGGRDSHVLARFRRLGRFGLLIDVTVGVGVDASWRPTLRLRDIAGLVPDLGIDPAGHRTGAGVP